MPVSEEGLEDQLIQKSHSQMPTGAWWIEYESGHHESGGLWGHTRYCVPDKIGPTEGSPNLNPAWPLAATQTLVAVAYKVIRVPTSVIRCLELQRAPCAGRGQ